MNVKEFYKEMYGKEAKQCVIIEQMQNIFDFAEAYAQHKVESIKLNKHDVMPLLNNRDEINIYFNVDNELRK